MRETNFLSTACLMPTYMELLIGTAYNLA